MVVLGRWRFLMNEVPLHPCSRDVTLSGGGCELVGAGGEGGGGPPWFTIVDPSVEKRTGVAWNYGHTAFRFACTGRPTGVPRS